jgi:PadR family transcriptional regulator PadR
MNQKFIDNWITQLKKTILPLLIMNMLDKDELYGYLLIVRIKECTGYEVSEGTIYPILNRLKTDGWVDHRWIEQQTGIPRKYYKLTSEGKKILKQLNLNWKDVITEINKQIDYEKE